MASTSTSAPTTKLSQQQNLDLLNEQRAKRPSSPHFTIYQPQITWYLSIINRITGTGLSVREYPPPPFLQPPQNNPPAISTY